MKSQPTLSGRHETILWGPSKLKGAHKTCTTGPSGTGRQKHNTISYWTQMIEDT